MNSKLGVKLAEVPSDGRLIVSFPKSGRTWLRYALTTCGINVATTHAGASTNRRELGTPFCGIPPILADRPMVFLYRNPFDTAVSLFYQVNRRDLRRGSGRWFRMVLPLWLKGAIPPADIDAFVLHPIYGIEKICAYNRAWLDHLEGRKDCLILSYEEMRAEPSKGFQTILDFWGEKNTTGEALSEVSTMEKMKAVEASGLSHARLRAAVAGDANSAKVRKGKVGGYHNELKPKTIEQGMKIVAKYGFV